MALVVSPDLMADSRFESNVSKDWLELLVVLDAVVELVKSVASVLVKLEICMILLLEYLF